MCTHLDDDMSICWKAQVIMQLNVRALNYFDDCSLMLRWLGYKRYVYLGAEMLIYLYAHMVLCSHVHIFVYSHA